MICAFTLDCRVSFGKLSFLAMTLIGFFVLPGFASATVCTWDGSSSNLWNVAANWDTLPQAGDDLVFPASASNKSNSNDFAADTSFNSITFNGSGYTLAGNRIT